MKREYYEAKPVAQAALGRLFDAHPEIMTGDVQLEPYKGWVVMIMLPAGADGSPFEAQGVEVQYHGSQGAQSAARHRSSSSTPASASSGSVAAPTKGVTARVWEIASELEEKLSGQPGAALRPAIIAECERQGINAATAATQYSKWKRSRGL